MEVTVLIHQKDQPGDDIFNWAFDRTHKAVATTDHAASSYGQPVIVGEDGKLWDYADLKGITYYGQVTAEDIAALKSLEAFGLTVAEKADVIYE